MGQLLLKNATQVVTCQSDGKKSGKKQMNAIGLLENTSVLIEDDVIQAIDSFEQLKEDYDLDTCEVIDCNGKTITPGFIDSHTHIVFGGYRADEYQWRLEGMDYMEIMNKGGGIANSVNATKEESFDQLYQSGIKRLNKFAEFGVTTVEGKSGYGLDKDTELKQLKVMKQLNIDHPLDIVPTFLGAHSVPQAYKGKEDEFIDFIIEEVLPEVTENNLAEFCDIFCEDNVFTVDQSRKLLLEAQAMGLASKIHADEIVQLGGAELAAEINATSADHLLQASDAGIKALAAQGVVATVLPATAFSLQEDYARARDMIDQGCAVALASDFNPGSCHTQSTPLLIALATIKMKMTIEETINALTINAAAAVNREETLGNIEVGKKADLLIHEFPSYQFLAYYIGVSTVEKVIKNGKLILDKELNKVL
jgi:imidazolonepropionase